MRLNRTIAATVRAERFFTGSTARFCTGRLGAVRGTTGLGRRRRRRGAMGEAGSLRTGPRLHSMQNNSPSAISRPHLIHFTLIGPLFLFFLIILYFALKVNRGRINGPEQRRSEFTKQPDMELNIERGAQRKISSTVEKDGETFLCAPHS